MVKLNYLVMKFEHFPAYIVEIHGYVVIIADPMCLDCFIGHVIVNPGCQNIAFSLSFEFCDNALKFCFMLGQIVQQRTGSLLFMFFGAVSKTGGQVSM